jgi:hypothetical protein
MKTKNFLNILLIAVCLSAILGCKAISDLGGKSSDNTTPTTSPTTTSTSTPAPSATPNKLVGNWSGKSANGSTSLKMVFTNDEWTLSSNGTPVRGTQKYKFIDSDTIEVTTGDGSKFPMEVEVNGDTLTVDMRGTKVVMTRDK